MGPPSRAGGQEPAPPCNSIIPHPCSSQGPGTKSKESLLSITKLFNRVISRVFFIPFPFAAGNETWWKIWCTVSHTNKGPWITVSFAVVENSSGTMRNTFSELWMFQEKIRQSFYPWYLKKRAWKSGQQAALGRITVPPEPHVLTPLRTVLGVRPQNCNMIVRLMNPVRHRENNKFQPACGISFFLQCSKYENSWLVLSCLMHVGERKALPDISTEKL